MSYSPGPSRRITTEEHLELARQAQQEEANARGSEKEGSLLDTVGKLALGAGAAVAGVYGLSRLRGRNLAAAASAAGASPSMEETVRRAAATPPSSLVRQRMGEQITREARAERMPGVIQTDLNALMAERAARRPAETGYRSQALAQLDRTAPPSAEVIAARRLAQQQQLSQAVAQSRIPYQPELPGVDATLMALRSPLSQIVEESTGVLEAVAPSRPLSAAPAQFKLDLGTLTEQHQSNQLARINQAANATEAGAGQMSGRVRQQLQRNEDLNLNVIDQVEDATGSIDIAAAQTEDGIPFDQAEKASNFALAQMRNQRERLAATGLKGGRLERAMVYPEAVREAVEESMGLSAEDALTFQRQAPGVAGPNVFVQPASNTSLRGTSGRPELGIYGEVTGSTPTREVWGPGSVLTGKEVITEGENPVSRPQRYRPGIDLPEERTPEGYVYTQAALDKPTRVRYSDQPLRQEVTPERLESVKVSEDIRRLQREGGDVQGYLSRYLNKPGAV